MASVYSTSLHHWFTEYIKSDNIMLFVPSFSPVISQVLLNVYFVPGSISELEIYHPVKEIKVLILAVHVLNRTVRVAS